MLKMIALGAALALCACASAPDVSPAAQVEAHMRGYTEAWNRHDSATIARDFYRMGPTVEEQTASLERGFENLRAQGYQKSDIHTILGCMTGEDTAWAGMRFTRLKADGEPLPPKDRASAYELKKFPDGWRITRMMGADAASPLQCPS
jgi:hypothetical protein